LHFQVEFALSKLRNVLGAEFANELFGGVVANHYFRPLIGSPRCWERLTGSIADRIFILKMVEGILVAIPWLIQCYQQLQVFFAHVNLQSK
jgi:hypothetical protein